MNTLVVSAWCCLKDFTFAATFAPLFNWQVISFVISLQDLVIHKNPGEKLGISIRGGTSNQFGNPFDKTDEGIFISRVCASFIVGKALRQKTCSALVLWVWCWEAGLRQKPIVIIIIAVV